MDYPNITLKIEPTNVSVELHGEDHQVRTMYVADMSISQFLAELRKILEIESEAEQELLASGDEYFLDFSNLDLGDESLNVNDIVQLVNQQAEAYEQEAEMADHVAAEVKRNWQSDMLASGLEGLYNLLISKVVLMADDLGVEHIVLDDASANGRLREKMSNELAKFNIPLIVNLTDDQEASLQN